MSNRSLLFFYGFYPGLPFIDVTEIVYNDCISDNVITIVGPYTAKDELFTDPAHGLEKQVTVTDMSGNIIHIFSQHDEICLNLDDYTLEVSVETKLKV